MVAICTKNSLEIKKSKFSCKGLNKNNFSNPLSLYKRILFENSRAGEKKSRFPRAKQHYLTSFYPKRKVLSHGVTPTYLEIELCLGTSLLCIYPFCLVLRITPWWILFFEGEGRPSFSRLYVMLPYFDSTCIWKSMIAKILFIIKKKVIVLAGEMRKL